MFPMNGGWTDNIVTFFSLHREKDHSSSNRYSKADVNTVNIKSLHTPVKMPVFCDVKNETKINNFRTFSTFNVNYNLYN